MPPVLAIDPGTRESALVVMTDGCVTLAKVFDNARLSEALTLSDLRGAPLVIEEIQSFGMAVGKDIFRTVRWTGYFERCWFPHKVYWVGRKAVKLHLCGTSKAKDTNIRQALLDRFGGGSRTVAYGTKKQPGPLYGVTGHALAALAVAVTWQDTGSAWHEPLPALEELNAKPRKTQPAETELF